MQEKISQNRKSVEELKAFLRDKKEIPLKILRHASSVDVASLLLNLEKKEASFLFRNLLSHRLAASVLSEIPEPSLKEFLQGLDENSLISLFLEGPMDDLLFLIDFVEDKKALLEKLPHQRRLTFKKFMNYPENSTGRIMQDDFFSVDKEFTATEAIKKLRQYSREKFVHYVYAVDEKKLVGVLSIRQLAISDPLLKIKEVMNKNPTILSPYDPEIKASEMISHHNLIAIPVLDKDKKILGLITVDDVLDLIEEEADAKIYAMAGLPEDDRIYSKFYHTVKNRLPWLSLNLVLAFIASYIISLFEQTLSRLIILATLKNVVAGIGGNTGIQALTVTTRGLDTGDFKHTNFSRAFLKETFSGFITGLFLGVAAGLTTYLWKKSLLVAIIIVISMVANSLVAVWAGFLVPIFLRKMRKDPAVGSGAIVTVITDMFGFFVFLGLASLGLAYFGESL